MRNLFDYTGTGSNDDEIVVDLFAGGGGASQGIYQALGVHPHAAANHNPEAVSMHAANHPDTMHFCEDVWAISPWAMTQGRPVGLLWASPDCTHFSKAKGGAPVRNDKIRSLASVIVMKWLDVRPRVIVMENVEEFTTWGPLDSNGIPIKSAEGETYRWFMNRLRRAGYHVSTGVIRACDRGAPTTRTRWFLIARCDDEPILWPRQTHGDPNEDANAEAIALGKMLPWRTAAECIDWGEICPSIFMTKEEAAEFRKETGITVRRPLAENTMRRIARGLDRFVLNNPDPFIVNLNHTASYYRYFRGHGIDEPFRTITKAPGMAIVAPHLTTYYGARNGDHLRGQHLNEPVRTIPTANRFGIVMPWLAKHYGGVVGITANGPCSTITSVDHHALVSPTLIQTGYGERKGQAPRAPGLQKPLGTVVAAGIKHAVVMANMMTFYGKSVGRSMGSPLATNMTKERHALVMGFLEKQFGNTTHHDTREPLGTIMSTGQGKHAMMSVDFVSKFKGDNVGLDLGTPLHTIESGGNKFARVRAFLMKYYSEGGQDQSLRDPMHTLTTKARMGLVAAAETYQIADIGMRMLQPRELYRAQGFPESYIIDRGADGTTLSKEAQVRMVGNSVCPDVAEGIVANNVELRTSKKVEAAA